MRKIIDKGLELSLIFLMAFLVVDVLWQVLSRYILVSPSSVTDELAGYLLITNLITALVSGLLSDWIHPNITITEVLLLIQSAVLILFLLSHALTDKTFLLQVFRKVERSH